MPKLVLQNAKIFKVFSMFNFIKALTPKFSQNNPKKWPWGPSSLSHHVSNSSRDRGLGSRFKSLLRITSIDLMTTLHNATSTNLLVQGEFKY